MPSDAAFAAAAAAAPPSADLRRIVVDGALFSVMVGLGETYVPAFALAAGFGEVVAGLVATLPMLAGALVQLVTPRGVAWFGSYRRWVVACATLQALAFVPLLVGAARGEIAFGWLAVATAGYWAFGMAASPAWNAWVTSLVPPDVRVGFFARRNRAAQAALLGAVTVGGLLLEQGRRHDRVLELFAGLFAAALAVRLCSARVLALQTERAGLAADHRSLSLVGVARAVRAAGHGRILVYLLGMQFAVYLAAPFFTPYMLGPLRLPYSEFMLLTATALLARVLVLPFFGRLAQRRGVGVLLFSGAIGITPLPALWNVASDYGYLLLLQAISGVAWAAVELATVLVFFDGIAERDRTSVLTGFNFANTVAMASGALLGGELLTRLGDDAGAYAWLFGLSSLVRLLVLPVLWRVAVPKVVPVVALRTVAVRPSAGAIQRPIVASLEPPAAAAEPDSPGRAPDR